MRRASGDGEGGEGDTEGERRMAQVSGRMECLPGPYVKSVGSGGKGGMMEKTSMDDWLELLIIHGAVNKKASKDIASAIRDAIGEVGEKYIGELEANKQMCFDKGMVETLYCASIVGVKELLKRLGVK